MDIFRRICVKTVTFALIIQDILSLKLKKTAKGSPDHLTTSFWTTFFSPFLPKMSLVFQRLVSNIVKYQQIPSVILTDTATFLSKGKKSKDDNHHLHNRKIQSGTTIRKAISMAVFIGLDGHPKMREKNVEISM